MYFFSRSMPWVKQNLLLSGVIKTEFLMTFSQHLGNYEQYLYGQLCMVNVVWVAYLQNLLNQASHKIDYLWYWNTIILLLKIAELSTKGLQVERVILKISRWRIICHFLKIQLGRDCWFVWFQQLKIVFCLSFFLSSS